MFWLTVLAWVGGAAAILAATYGMHRLGLWLEERGHIYYWHKQSTVSASRMWTPPGSPRRHGRSTSC